MNNLFRRALGWVGVMAASISTVAAAADATAAVGPAGGRRELRFELEGKWIGLGACFSPYRDGQQPGGTVPTEDQVRDDLRLVARYWNFIRMYDSGPVTERTLAVIRRERLPVRLLLGAWLNPETDEATRAANRSEVANAIRLANTYPELVVAVTVGNEACVFWSGHLMGPEALMPWIRQVRSAIRQPVSTGDDYNFWNKEPARAVAAEVDFITLHAYALWNERQVDEAMAWTAGIYDSIVRMHAGVPVIFGETGWVTRNDPTRLGPGGEGTKMKGEVPFAPRRPTSGSTTRGCGKPRCRRSYSRRSTKTGRAAAPRRQPTWPRSTGASLPPIENRNRPSRRSSANSTGR